MFNKSQPTTLDYSKHGNELMQSKLKLMQDRAALMEKEPMGNEAEAELFKNIKDSMGGKRKPAYQTIIEGLMNGVQYGMNKKNVDEKIAKYQKMQEFFSSFEEATAAMEKQNNINMENEKLRANAEPYGVAALELAYSNMSYEDVNTQMAQLFQQAKLNNPGIQGDYAGFVPKTPNVLMRGQDGKITSFSLASIVPEDTIKRVTQNAINQQSADARTMSAQASMTNAGANVMRAQTDASWRPTELRERTRRNDIAEKNANIKFDALGVKSVKEIMPKLESATIASKISEDLLKEAKANPKLFGSWASAFINTKGDSKAYEIWAQQTAVSKKDRDALMRIAKNVASLQLAEAKALGGQNNQTLDAWMQQMFPNGQYSQSNFIHIMEQNKLKYDFYKDMYRDTLNQDSNAYIGEAYDKRAQQLYHDSALVNQNLYSNPKRVAVPQEVDIPPARSGISYKTPDGKMWDLTNEQYNKLPPEIRKDLSIVN